MRDAGEADAALCEAGRLARKSAVVVGAPSGYGKSTLISHWIDIAGLRGRTAWLSLDEDDADPHEFMSQMAAAVDTVVPGVLEAVQPILEDTHGDANRAMRRLLATLEAEDDLLLVLDDLQRVDSPQIHAAHDCLRIGAALVPPDPDCP
ncbi:MAG: AAA family ATPase [Caldilineaceae bacterium]